MTKWAVFTVIISLLPFFMLGCDLWTDGKIGDILTMWQHGDMLWPHGELLLVAIALAGDAAGGFIASDSETDLARSLKLLSTGGCILLAIGSAWWYQSIQDKLPKTPANPVSLHVVTGSGVVLLVSILVGFFCKVFAED